MVLMEIGILLLDKFLGFQAISSAERRCSEAQTWAHGVPGAWRCIVIITVENLAFGRERCERLARHDWSDQGMYISTERAMILLYTSVEP